MQKGKGDDQVKHSLFDILFRPGAFFQHTILEKESLKIPALIVFVLGIVSAFYAYLVGGVTGKMMAGLIIRNGINNRHFFGSRGYNCGLHLLGDMGRCFLPGIILIQRYWDI